MMHSLNYWGITSKDGMPCMVLLDSTSTDKTMDEISAHARAVNHNDLTSPFKTVLVTVNDEIISTYSF